MKLSELKRRLTLAAEALKGAPLVYDLPMPKLTVETQPIQTIQARFEMCRQDADMLGLETTTVIAERKLLEKLTESIGQSGLVQIRRKNTGHAVIYEARVRAIAPREDDEWMI